MKLIVKDRPEITGQLILAVPLSVKKRFIELRKQALKANIDFKDTLTDLLVEFADELTSQLKKRGEHGDIPSAGANNHAQERI